MKALICALLAVAAVSVSGCASTRAEGRTAYGVPTVYAGTRLNMAALNEDYGKLAVYRSYGGIEPPENPIIDAPISFVVDTVVLPMDAWYWASDKVGLGRPSFVDMLAFDLRDRARSPSKAGPLREIAQERERQ
ncbi:uncharacterized protein YceK [Panacagrimonas perspica]|uniref:Uncharacterized protein YceK n=1 Tax=Panacagrimonas perspica TaxID=381431 RepID=A0A4R7NYC9_9GAMM|nr:YceK/YidQ family lipoprotein [Panacagrimonas perspica]TDU25540.1 uncharacterized protein YceK [Panacagrimonas perspica]THD03855.1 hypothetical protein B1810_08295 [Panacagrimonas perspica]